MKSVQAMKLIRLFTTMLICLVVFTAIWPARAEADTADTYEEQKRVLFINSYGYDFEVVPIVIGEVSDRLKGVAAVQYLFMNEKYMGDGVAEDNLSAQLDDLCSRFKYDAVILGDDGAFDYAIKNRQKYFDGVPLIYECINDTDKAAQYASDPLICGIVEKFPIKENISLALNLYPDAENVVVITDDSSAGKGSANQVMKERETFPNMSFSVFNCSTMAADEIREKIGEYGRDTILIYGVFNEDGEGNRYSLPQGIEMITSSAKIPVFKADEAGVGNGLLGGYALSYENIGDVTAQLVKDALKGKLPDGDNSLQFGNCKYMIDQKVMEHFGLSKSSFPKKTMYINKSPGFFEKYEGIFYVVLFIVLIYLLLANIKNRQGYKDIQRKLAEKAQVSEKELQLCYQQMGQSICRFDVEKRTIYIPGEAAERLGIDEKIQNVPESVKELPLFATKDDYEKFARMIQDIYSGVESGNSTVRIRYTDDSCHYKNFSFKTIFNSNEKPARAVFTARDVTGEYEAKRLANQWHEASETDALTGLFNRGGGEKRIRQFLASGKPGLFCLMDIDRFKEINDTFGHRIGDDALRVIAECMNSSFRKKDVIIRFGGDEFAVLAEGISSRKIAEICIERFYNKLSNAEVPGMDGRRLSASMGAVIIEKEHDYNFDTLYNTADKIMYQCKHKTDKRYEFN